MELLRISEIELNGVLFCEFPTSWTIDQARAVLEECVRLCGYAELDAATIYMGVREFRKRFSKQ